MFNVDVMLYMSNVKKIKKMVMETLRELGIEDKAKAYPTENCNRIIHVKDGIMQETKESENNLRVEGESL